MKLFFHIKWIPLVLMFLVAGCAPSEADAPTSTPSTIQVDITPAARPAIPAVNACDTALADIQVQIEERYPSQADGDLLIRLDVPEASTAFLAQIATEELALVLHPDNPAASLTQEEIQALFAGQITNWSQLNGSDVPVSVWVPLEDDETRIAFDEKIMQGLPLVPNARIAPDPGAMQQIITANAGAVGYLPAGWQPSGLHAILLGIQLPVLVMTPQTPDGSIAELIACLQGEVGQQALSEVYP